MSIPATSLGRIPNANSLRQHGKNPKAPALAADPPDYLDELAAEEWARVLPLLQGTITERDLTTLAAYCQSVSDWLQASASAAQHPRVITTPNGALQTSPYVTQSRQSREDMTKLAAHLGLTPASRLRMNGAPAPSGTDPMFQ